MGPLTSNRKLSLQNLVTESSNSDCETVSEAGCGDPPSLTLPPL